MVTDGEAAMGLKVVEGSRKASPGGIVGGGEGAWRCIGAFRAPAVRLFPRERLGRRGPGPFASWKGRRTSERLEFCFRCSTAILRRGGERRRRRRSFHALLQDTVSYLFFCNLEARAIQS